MKPQLQPKKQADILREFLRWARSQGKVPQQEAETVYRILDLFESYTRIEPDNLESRLHSLRHQSGLEIFPLNQAMLDRAVELSFQNLGLEPFDQAILAAVLVRAEQLIGEGAEQLAFCEFDSDLQPWDRKGDNKPLLAELYRPLPIEIYNNFLLQHPQWPK